MIAQPQQRTVEPQSSRGNVYWLASGEAYGRTILAEGQTREEAVKEWISAAADRQAEQMQLHGRIAYNRVMDFINS